MDVSSSRVPVVLSTSQDVVKVRVSHPKTRLMIEQSGISINQWPTSLELPIFSIQTRHVSLGPGRETPQSAQEKVEIITCGGRGMGQPRIPERK
eukprot:scaffold8602_cov196-Amphora_coffeaeformis.AAC.10